MTRKFSSIVIVCLAAAALGCAALSGKDVSDKQPIAAAPIEPQPAEWRVTDDVIMITDASGTQFVNETFPDAKALTRSFVAAMPEANVPAASGGGYSAGAIGFGGDDRNTVPLSSFNRSALAGQAESLEVMGAVDGMGGPTPLHTVLSESAKALEGRSGRAALVIFSDGLPDEPGLALGVAKLLSEEHTGGLCVHTVQTGDDPEGTSFLQGLAGLTSCGTYRNASQISSNFEVQQLARAVFIGPGVFPVASAGPCDGIVRLRGIEFGFDKANVSESSKPLLDVAVERLSECPEINITITGHTDSMGAAEYNNGLSYQRAEATKNYLVSKGVSASRLSAEGVGEAQPVAPNDSKDGRAQNRRVEIGPSN
jgi:outer membrane protein OmpA-like peptidoglycan-associated protein